jgi:transcriptional regulator with XRE-family HTH domain
MFCLGHITKYQITTDRRKKVTGSEFRSWRRSQEISQQKVADNVKCSKSAICRWEKGEFNLVPPLYEKILKFYNSYAR